MTSPTAAGSTSQQQDCPVCLQALLQPVRLPCAHVFCFLCVKGAAARNRSCPMCRGRIPNEFWARPELVQEGEGEASVVSEEQEEVTCGSGEDDPTEYR